jgi:hypothetical protein
VPESLAGTLAERDSGSERTETGCDRHIDVHHAVASKRLIEIEIVHVAMPVADIERSVL